MQRREAAVSAISFAPLFTLPLLGSLLVESSQVSPCGGTHRSQQELGSRCLLIG